VEGATVYHVHKGDIILIPPKTPHKVSEVDGELALWSMHLPMDAQHAVPSKKTAYAEYLAKHSKAK
jgi:quercetin dioxygenase-like cupin family protein